MEYIELLKKRRDELKDIITQLERQLITDREEYNQIVKLLDVVGKESGEVSSHYPSGGNLRTKVTYVVRELGEATAVDIFNKMKEYDSSVSMNSVTTTSSQMYADQQLRVVRKNGKQNVYSI